MWGQPQATDILETLISENEKLVNVLRNSVWSQPRSMLAHVAT